MRTMIGIQGATRRAALLAATMGVFGGGAVASAAPAAPETGSLTGRLVSPQGESLAGTIVVAEELIGGRTATVRALTSASSASQPGASAPIPGVYTTTAEANGFYRFPNLPRGRYTVMARQGDQIGLQIGVEVGGAHIAQATIMQVAQAGTIEGKVRYDQPNVPAPDNSGILVFVAGTSLLGYTQGASGDYSIPNVPFQQSTDPFYRVVATASGFADADMFVPSQLASDSVQAPLIVLTPGAYVVGRVTDPSVSDPNKQQVPGASIVVATGQSATSDADGYFVLQGLRPGGNYVTITKSPYRIVRKQFGPLVPGLVYILPVPLQK
jgi:carboxypeptidase family protein